MCIFRIECPTIAVENKTLKEAWNGENPMAESIFLDQRRTKLDYKSRKCLFLRVSDESKVCRLYDPISKNIIISKDVVFVKEENWD